MLDRVGFQVEHGERILSEGKTEKGKSTILQLIEGMCTADNGNFHFV